MARKTSQRSALLKAFEHAGRPLSPTESLALARPHARGLGIATVYRNLKFLMQRGVHFPTLIGNAAVTDAYKVLGLPSIFVIDPKGKFVYRAYGYSPGLGETLNALSNEVFRTDETAKIVVEAPPL